MENKDLPLEDIYDDPPSLVEADELPGAISGGSEEDAPLDVDVDSRPEAPADATELLTDAPIDVDVDSLPEVPADATELLTDTPLDVDVDSRPEVPADATELLTDAPIDVDVDSLPEAPADATELLTDTPLDVDVDSLPEVPADATELPPSEKAPTSARSAAHEPCAGDTVEGGYTVGARLDVASGEAELYLVEREGKTYVLKLYRKERPLNREVAEKRMAIDSPYVARLYAYGYMGERPYEITEYYKNGSLAGRTFSPEALRSFIIPDVNEALRVLHTAGIRHRDIKPSNLMLTDDGAHVALIDFGVSSVFESENDLNLTKTGMTPEYAAPETFRNFYLNESDYYSFGITLYTLYFGSTPYEGLPKRDIENYSFLQSIPFKGEIPEDLRDLILGLTYASIVDRNDEENPNRRWTYREVADFCQGKRPPLPGHSIGKIGRIRPYTLAGETFDTLDALVDGLARHWDAGKRALFRGHITEHFRLEDPNPLLFQICKEAERLGAEEGVHDDRAYFYFLYRLRPNLSVLYWRRARYDSVAALGIDMLDALDAAEADGYRRWPAEERLWSELLSEGVLSRFYEYTEQSEAVTHALAEAEATYAVYTERRDRVRTYYLVAYLLSGRRILKIGGLPKFATVRELTAHLDSLAERSFAEVKAFCATLVRERGNLHPAFEAWLIANGEHEAIAKWRKRELKEQ